MGYIFPDYLQSRYVPKSAALLGPLRVTLILLSKIQYARLSRLRRCGHTPLFWNDDLEIDAIRPSPGPQSNAIIICLL